MTTPSSKTFLGLPPELRNKIYKEVFADSQISLVFPEDHLYEASLHDFNYTGPENYRALLICSQVKCEATPVLLASICLYIDAGCSCVAVYPIDLVGLCQRWNAPRFLRRAISHIRRIKFQDQHAGRLFSDFNAFPQLRELHIIFDLWHTYCPELLPDNVLVQNPLLTLGQAHDYRLIEAALQISQHHRNSNLASCLEAAAIGTSTYQVILESHIIFLRPPSVYEPAEAIDWQIHDEEGWPSDLRAQMAVYFTLDLANMVFLHKRFSLMHKGPYPYPEVEDPKEFLGQVQEQSRPSWRQGAIPRTILPE